MFRLFECCALSFFERFVLSFSLKIERFVSDSAEIWICGLYISNITLVKAIKYIGPTLTSIFGALEPLTAVVIGCLIFNESFTPASAIGMALIITAVTVVVVHEKKKESES